MKKWNLIIPLLSILSTIVLSATINRRIEITSFNAGQMSPLMNARSDFTKTKSGAKTLQNMLVRAQGPVQRRPGTKYIATVKDSNDPVRLIPFEYSTTDAYVIELGDLYARFYRNGGQILDPNNNAYEIVTPWDANDLFELQFAQDAQYMRVVHPDYQPYKLTRTAHASWTCTAIDFINGPFLPENTDTSVTITPSATTGNITLSSTGSSVWDSNHVGAQWEISHYLSATSTSGTFTTNGDANSATITVWEDQYYEWKTGGIWIGTVTLQRSYDSGATWENAESPFISANGAAANIQSVGQETEGKALYRIYMDDLERNSHAIRHDEGICSYMLSTRPFVYHGVVEITAVSDVNDCNATVQKELGSASATWRWAEGTWSTYRGWPRTVEHHEQRCVYGGSASYPQTVWASIIADEDADYDNFVEGDADEEDAWTYILPGMNPIQWLKSTEYLMIGTTSGVGRLGTPDKPISPIWPPMYRSQAKNGCTYMQPVAAVDAILYLERGGQKIRELSYSYSSDRYVAPDMTILSEDITGDGIVQMDFQNRPDPILWMIREDGVLLSFTYQRKHDVLAFAEHSTGTTDDVNSVAIIPGTNEDVVYWMVRRDINGNSVGMIEYAQLLDWGSDQNDCYFVDSGVDANDNLSHLEGRTVVIWGDGRPDSNSYAVSSGAIVPDVNYTNETIGLPFTSVLETMPLVTFDTEGQLTSASRTRIINVQVDCMNSLGFHIGLDSSHTNEVRFSSDSFVTTMDLYTGLKPEYGPMPFMGGWTREPVVYITENAPVPLTVRGLIVNAEVSYD